MSFIKHHWVNGEKLTAAQLNRIEDAIEELFDNEIDIATEADCDALFEDFLED